MLYVPRASSLFQPKKFGSLSNKFISYIIIWLYQPYLINNLLSFSGFICLFWYFYWYFFWLWINIWIFCDDFIVILSVILLPIKSPVASVGFWNALSRFTAADFLIYSRSFSQLIYLDNIYSCLYPCFQQKKKKKFINFHNYTISKFNWITSHFLFVIP